MSAESRTPKGPQRVAQIVAEFVEIPFPDHDARVLALAYRELQQTNQWLHDDVLVKVETIARLEVERDRLEIEVRSLREGWDGWQKQALRLEDDL